MAFNQGLYNLYGNNNNDPYANFGDPKLNIPNTSTSNVSGTSNAWQPTWLQDYKQPYDLGTPPAEATMSDTKTSLNPYLQGLGTAGLGALETGFGLYGLSQMGQAPNYSISPELQNAYNTAQGNARTGFSPAERINYQQDVAGQQSATRRNALDIGGGQLSGTINGILAGDKLKAANEFAGQDAALQRSNQQYADRLGSQVQNQRDQMKAQEIDQFNHKQSAYGGATKSGFDNIGSYVNMVGSLAPLLALL